MGDGTWEDLIVSFREVCHTPTQATPGAHSVSQFLLWETISFVRDSHLGSLPSHHPCLVHGHCGNWHLPFWKSCAGALPGWLLGGIIRTEQHQISVLGLNIDKLRLLSCDRCVLTCLLRPERLTIQKPLATNPPLPLCCKMMRSPRRGVYTYKCTCSLGGSQPSRAR